MQRLLSQVVFDPALRERHIGDLQGVTLQVAATEKPEAYKAFLSHKRNHQIPVSNLVLNYYWQIFCLLMLRMLTYILAYISVASIVL
jgi:broad specificity phosphatase PhoE